MGEAKIMGGIELNEQLIPKIGRTAVWIWSKVGTLYKKINVKV